ncbi:MAG: hypothetical protein A2498_00895 [Lentisphaerae bacterium RIFOXYC12_FULL_60_16]|nr:MAG: hypothetical protein A2498_00895 [Lentisphaerae bacterium RIFOXYC12_FULL_60_16]
MIIPNINPSKHHPPEMVERITALNREAGRIMEASKTLEARLVELRDPATLTPASVAERVKALAKNRTERLALMATARTLAADWLALLAEIKAVDDVETARLAEAGNKRREELRSKLMELTNADELDVRRALVKDANLQQICADGAAVGQGHFQRVRAFEEMHARLTAEMGALLAA